MRLGPARRLAAVVAVATAALLVGSATPAQADAVPLQEHGRVVVRGVVLRLTEVAAGALNGALRASVFTGGLTFGTARVTLRV